MPNTIPANGGAMPAKALSRRAALGALASVPALALPAATAALAMPAGPTLSELIEAHRIAHAAFNVEVDALEAATPEYGARFECLGVPFLKVGSRPETLLKEVDVLYKSAAEKLKQLDQLAPEIAAAAHAHLDREQEADHARVEAIFADYRAAEVRYSDTCDAEEEALTAICAYRCATFDELAEKGRFLFRHCQRNELTCEQYDALLEALLPEGETVEA